MSNSLTALTPLALHAQPVPALPLPRQKIVALLGDSRAVHTLILQSLCIRAARGKRLALVVGDNHFDVYRLARLARAHGLDPAALLQRVELSRPFTCYQLHHRVATLGASRCRYDALYVPGLLETFYDEDIPPGEAARLLKQTLGHFKATAAQGLPVLLSAALPHQAGREAFLEIVKRAADRYWQPPPAVLREVNARQLAFAEFM